MRIRSFLLASVLLCALPLHSQAKKKPAWEWTLEERIAALTNPELARMRLGERRQRVQSTSTASPWVDSYDGKTHPELFLPHEVFEQLISMAFVADARITQGMREGFMPEVTRHGLPRDFWSRLETITTIYVADERALRDLHESRDKQNPAQYERMRNLKYKDECRTRADALAAARQAFGRERFDRFLYEVIAVSMFTATDLLPDGARLRDAEEGCR